MKGVAPVRTRGWKKSRGGGAALALDVAGVLRRSGGAVECVHAEAAVTMARAQARTAWFLLPFIGSEPRYGRGAPAASRQSGAGTV